MFNLFAARHLTWWPELGIGYYPVEVGVKPYDEEYFDRFARQAASPIGQVLMASRVRMVAKYFNGPVVDIGIGSGAFIEARREDTSAPTYGYDVNPKGIAWLKERRAFLNPYIDKVPAITCWDVLEHISEFDELLRRVTGWVFVSIPIFSGPSHILRSKHYRKDEHVWYFTQRGLVGVFEQFGFSLVEASDMEVRAGREDIGTFVFKRRSA